MAGHLQRVAEGGKKALDRNFSPARGRYRGNAGSKGEWLVYQLGALGAGAVQGRTEGFDQGHAQVGGAHIGPVVDVLLQARFVLATAYQVDGVDVEEEGYGGFLLVRFGVEYVGLADREVEGLEAVRVLVQQVAEVGGGGVGGGEGE